MRCNADLDELIEYRNVLAQRVEWFGKWRRWLAEDQMHRRILREVLRYTRKIGRSNLLHTLGLRKLIYGMKRVKDRRILEGDFEGGQGL